MKDASILPQISIKQNVFFNN